MLKSDNMWITTKNNELYRVNGKSSYKYKIQILAKYMAFPGIVCWLEAVAAVTVSLYHTLWVGSAGTVVKAATATAPVD